MAVKYQSVFKSDELIQFDASSSLSLISLAMRIFFNPHSISI